MKIAVIGAHFTDSFPRNICATLTDMGHEVYAHAGTMLRHNKGVLWNAFWGYGPKLVPALEYIYLQQMYGEVANFRPDLLLVPGAVLKLETVHNLKKAAQAPAFCWYTDAIVNARDGSLFLAGYDVIFCKEPRFVDILVDKTEIDARYLPEACNPLWHQPVEPSEADSAVYGCDIATQGTFHPYRAKFYESFLGTGLSVKIWGSVDVTRVPTPTRAFFTGKFVGEREKSLAFRSAKIVVNNMHFGEFDGVNWTTFEAAGCGAFQICDEKPVLPDLFKIDEEIVTFRTRRELMEKVHYYLSPEGEHSRLAIRERAWKRAHRDHTYRNRLQTILSAVSSTTDSRAGDLIAAHAASTAPSAFKTGFGS
jgi:spore maturation protein CgeB